jgi:hypothetical protein
MKVFNLDIVINNSVFITSILLNHTFTKTYAFLKLFFEFILECNLKSYNLHEMYELTF